MHRSNRRATSPPGGPTSSTSESRWTPDGEPACRCGECLVCEVDTLAGPVVEAPTREAARGGGCRARRVQDRLRLVQDNQAVMGLAVAESNLHGEEMVVLVLDTRDPQARRLADAIVRHSPGIGLDHDAASRRRLDLTTGISVIPLVAATVAFCMGHPEIADGLRPAPPARRVRVVVVAAGGATLLHLPVVKLGTGGRA